MGYTLKKINHIIYFGYEILPTNTIEWLYLQIKRLNNNFLGLSASMTNKSNFTDKEKKDYLNGWIDYSLFLREIENTKYNWNEK